MNGCNGRRAGRGSRGKVATNWVLAKEARGEGYIKMKRSCRGKLTNKIYLPGERESGGDLLVEVCVFVE